MNIAYENKLPVAIYDSQPLIVEGLRILLAGSNSYRLLEPARSLEALLHSIVTASPRVAIVDKAPGMPALLEWLGRATAHGRTSVVVWGASLTDAEAIRLIQAGARGVLRKTARPENLLACLDSLSNGGTFMDDRLFHSDFTCQFSSRTDLTAREQQVLGLVEQGLRNKDIARELGIQPGTVKIHLKHIFEKSGVRGRYSLVLSGLRDRYDAQAMTA